MNPNLVPVVLIIVTGLWALVRLTVDARPLLDVTPETDPTPAFPVWLVRGRWVPPCPEVRRLNASLREWRGDVRKGVAG